MRVYICCFNMGLLSITEIFYLHYICNILCDLLMNSSSFAVSLTPINSPNTLGLFLFFKIVFSLFWCWTNNSPFSISSKHSQIIFAACAFVFGAHWVLAKSVLRPLYLEFIISSYLLTLLKNKLHLLTAFWTFRLYSNCLLVKSPFLFLNLLALLQTWVLNCSIFSGIRFILVFISWFNKIICLFHPFYLRTYQLISLLLFLLNMRDSLYCWCFLSPKLHLVRVSFFSYDNSSFLHFRPVIQFLNRIQLNPPFPSFSSDQRICLLLILFFPSFFSDIPNCGKHHSHISYNCVKSTVIIRIITNIPFLPQSLNV